MRINTKNVIQSILVVQDYPDIFPKELLEMPPKQEIEFSTDFLLGMLPISRALYHMGRVPLTKLDN